jgi:hypothetical protein
MDEDTDVEGPRGGEADPSGPDGGLPPSTAFPSVPPPVPPPGAGSGVPAADTRPPGATAPGQADARGAVDHDGPPPPPFVRARRRRRQRLLLAFAILVVVGTPIGLAVARSATDAGVLTAPGEGTVVPEADPGPDGDPGAQLLAPDLAQLDGLDAIYGRLLVDIDASEQVMLGFQQDLVTALQGVAPTDPELLDRLAGIADDRRSELLDVRARLAEELPDAGADAVRDRYVEHLDAWADYLQAIADDPTTLAQQDDRSGYNVVINVTADAFARALEEELPGDIDDGVERFADAILERGFRNVGEANV